MRSTISIYENFEILMCVVKVTTLMKINICATTFPKHKISLNTRINNRYLAKRIQKLLIEKEKWITVLIDMWNLYIIAIRDLIENNKITNSCEINCPISGPIESKIYNVYFGNKRCCKIEYK